MSYVVARMQKMKAGNLGGAFKHNERIFKNHSNKDIDSERSHLNYDVLERDSVESYEKAIKDYVNQNKKGSRAIRKDAVLCAEWIITSDHDFFEKLDDLETKRFFRTAVGYFEQKYGSENIAYSKVHLDETTPHLHLGIVPLKDGVLSSKNMFNREELKAIQDELPKFLNDRYFEIERGKKGSEKKHLNIAEFKELQDEIQAKNQELESITEELKKYNHDQLKERKSESYKIAKKLKAMTKNMFGHYILDEPFYKRVLKYIVNVHNDFMKVWKKNIELNDKLEQAHKKIDNLETEIESYKKTNDSQDIMKTISGLNSKILGKDDNQIYKTRYKAIESLLTSEQKKVIESLSKSKEGHIR